MSIKLYAGDRVLIKNHGVISWLIRWWTSSDWNHLVPVLNQAGDILQIDLRGGVRIENLSMFIHRKCELLVLRPAIEFTAEQQANFLNAAWSIIGRKYDWLSFGAFLLNRKDLQRKKRFNCSEGTLFVDQAAGLLLNRPMTLISPLSYSEFWSAGMFKLVAHWIRPRKGAKLWLLQ
jgi:hypothetical protein